MSHTEEDALWVKYESDPESDINNLQQADTIACVLFEIFFWFVDIWEKKGPFDLELWWGFLNVLSTPVSSVCTLPLLAYKAKHVGF